MDHGKTKESVAVAAGSNVTRTSSISPTRGLPKKGILKNVDSSNRRSISTSNASNCMNTSPSLSPDSKAKVEYNKRMHFDEMNIIATHHPADKDYGFMKIDEPPTPYNKNEYSMSDDEVAASETTGIDASKLESELNLNRKKLPKYMQDQMNLDDDDEYVEDDKHTSDPEFVSHRKAHYNEFKMAQLLKNQIQDEDEEEEEEEEIPNSKTT